MAFTYHWQNALVEESLWPRVTSTIGRNPIALFCKLFVMQIMFFGMFALDNLEECKKVDNFRFQV